MQLTGSWRYSEEKIDFSPKARYRLLLAFLLDGWTIHPPLPRLSPRALRRCGSCLTGFGSSPPPKKPGTR